MWHFKLFEGKQLQIVLTEPHPIVTFSTSTLITFTSSIQNKVILYPKQNSQHLFRIIPWKENTVSAPPASNYFGEKFSIT